MNNFEKLFIPFICRKEISFLILIFIIFINIQHFQRILIRNKEQNKGSNPTQQVVNVNWVVLKMNIYRVNIRGEYTGRIHKCV